jgi:hypothetical protein
MVHTFLVVWALDRIILILVQFYITVSLTQGQDMVYRYPTEVALLVRLKCSKQSTDGCCPFVADTPFAALRSGSPLTAKSGPPFCPKWRLLSVIGSRHHELAASRFRISVDLYLRRLTQHVGGRSALPQSLLRQILGGLPQINGAPQITPVILVRPEAHYASSPGGEFQVGIGDGKSGFFLHQ